MKQRKINFNIVLDKGLKDIPGDEKKLRQVLGNLVSNALKFTPEDGEIKIESKDFGSYALISVCDSGSGITDEAKAKLFNKYTQSRNSEGTGLGLVITKGIIEAHDGKIWIEDNSPKGTKFMFTLPY